MTDFVILSDTIAYSLFTSWQVYSKNITSGNNVKVMKMTKISYQQANIIQLLQNSCSSSKNDEAHLTNIC